MNQYCYNIKSTSDSVNVEKLKEQVKNIYTSKKRKDLAFDKEKLPFIILYSKTDSQICIKMTSRAKKNVEQIEEIHKKLSSSDLKLAELTLEKPVLIEQTQCQWWDNECQLEKGQKWVTLEHNGPYFTHIFEPYEPHGAQLIYDKKPFKLNPTEERIANFYARRIISEQSGNVAQEWTKDSVFNNNFWQDFKTYLTKEHQTIFKDFKKLDFSKIVKKLLDMKEAEKDLDPKEKEKKKVRVAEKKQDYGYAVINGTKEPLGNFVIEPAAIFYGRGENPKRGKIKRDIEPEEVSINIGKDAKVPSPPPGRRWSNVLHDQNAAWVASWKDPIIGENKYVYFSAEGQLKGKSDLFKYEKARKLNHYIKLVREQYTNDLKSLDTKQRQLATVLYLIDNYGLRVGNEKDENETDTVGASTLRVEHVTTKNSDIIVFDFLGKDSIQYYKELKVNPIVFKNISDFLKNKKKTDPLFDLIDAADINTYLKTFDGDFSAKVFRTRLASSIMDESLENVKITKKDTQDDKKAKFLKANVDVAKVLNHRRTAPVKSGEMIKRYTEELKELKQQLKEAKQAGKSIEKIQDRINKKKHQIDSKQSTLEIAATTSLTNYIDPRIVVSWSKVNDMNISKVYTATLQRKFKWAIDTTETDWNYNTTELMKEMAELKPIDSSVPMSRKSVPMSRKSVPMSRKSVAVSRKPVPESRKPVPESLSNDLELLGYGKAVAVKGNTKPIKERLQQMGGRFNPKIVINGVTTPIWLFPGKQIQELQKAFNFKRIDLSDHMEKKAYTPPKISVDKDLEYEIPEEALRIMKGDNVKPKSLNIRLVGYKQSLILIGDTKDLKDTIKSLGGRSNKLTVLGKPTFAWVFPKDSLEFLKNKLNLSDNQIDTRDHSVRELSPVEFEQTADIFQYLNVYSKKEVDFINELVSKDNVSEYSEKILEKIDKIMLVKLLACIDNVNMSEQVLQLYIDNTDSSEIINDIQQKILPGTIPTYMLFIYIFKTRPELLKEMMKQK